jgi:glycosyltransferase involved in cell wall biosynthesis
MFMKLSVIIPAYNSEKTISGTLKSLMASDLPKANFEVLVIDDGSKDATVKIARQFKSVKVYARKHGGPAVQRNFGAKNAKGDIVFFTDSDCVASRDLLRKVIEDFQKNDIAGVGGVYKTLNKDSFVARYVGYEIGYRHEKEGKYTDFLGTYCCAYKREIFLSFGGFDEKFLTSSGEDPELSFRISRTHRLLMDKRLFVYHPHPATLSKYLKNQYQRAYWRVLMYKRFPNKILGEGYTGMEIPLASFFITMAILSLVFSVFSSELIYVSIFSLLLFYSVYFRLFSYLYRAEKMQIPFALFFLPLRTVICMIGFVKGILQL